MDTINHRIDNIGFVFFRLVRLVRWESYLMVTIKKILHLYY